MKAFLRILSSSFSDSSRQIKRRNRNRKKAVSIPPNKTVLFYSKSGQPIIFAAEKVTTMSLPLPNYSRDFNLAGSSVQILIYAVEDGKHLFAFNPDVELDITFTGKFSKVHLLNVLRHWLGNHNKLFSSEFFDGTISDNLLRVRLVDWMGSSAR